MNTMHSVNITPFVDSKTIHPDCPLPAMEEQGWISVEDRLPDGEIEVLIVFTIDSEDGHNIDTGSMFDGEWYRDSEPMYQDGETVTHWMPLPQKPDVNLPKGER